MWRPLDELIPLPLLPQGFHLRHVAGGYEGPQRALASHATSGSNKPIGPYIEGYLRFMRSPFYAPELALVVSTPHGEFAAFCICWLDEGNKEGHFEPVGKQPNFRRKGFGRAVLGEGLRRMRAQGMTAASVCVESDNIPAQRLYRVVGLRAIHRLFTYRKTL